jgi:NAD(P)-dependent dehydrogenase (short-subunit alcohol dehydrogenase family)
MPNTSFDYAGKVAVVTGVNREIGAAIAKLFVAAGAQVYAAYHGEPERVRVLDGARHEPLRDLPCGSSRHATCSMQGQARPAAHAKRLRARP